MSRCWSKALAMTTPLVFSTVLTFVVFTVMPVHIANPLSLSGLAVSCHHALLPRLSLLFL